MEMDTENRCAARNGDAICYERPDHIGSHHGVEPDGHLITWEDGKEEHGDQSPTKKPWTYYGRRKD